MTVHNLHGMTIITRGNSISVNRNIYLKQAAMSSKLLVWFEKHIDELNDKLSELSARVTNQKKLAVFYDSEGRLAQYPRRISLRISALKKIAECFEKGRKYTEKEVNEIIGQNISISDYATARREMYELKLIGRLSDGSGYWREY